MKMKISRTKESCRVDDGSKQVVRARRVKKVLKGSMLKEHQITLPLQLQTNGKKVKVEDNCVSKKKVKVEENCELSWDVLNIISKTLDFDDHFQFAGVCKNWRAFHKIYWRNYLASQEPLLLQFSFDKPMSFFFVSMPGQKVYCSKMPKFLFHSKYVTSSSRYFIMAGSNNSFLLIDPFTRIKKVTNISTFEYGGFDNHALLAFDKCSEEFVLVVLCSDRLHVYQSRNCNWVSYSTMEDGEKVVHFVVLHNIIYVVTNRVNIGVLSLNSVNIKFLKLKSTPYVKYRSDLKLVNCDEQLLLVDSICMGTLNVYKIDFSIMDYVELETLGDIALFYTLGQQFYALSNPIRWGYESNSVYAVSLSSPECKVHSGDDKKLQKCITVPVPLGVDTFMIDWYFRHIKYEVDCSLVE